MERISAIQSELEQLKDLLARVGAPASPNVLAPRYLCPSAAKMVDFRQEPGFSQAANLIVNEKRSTLDYNRLFTLWHAIHNTYSFNLGAAEVGSYKGGSAKFIALVHQQFGVTPPIHVVDTFAGHPDTINLQLDGPHRAGWFSDTSAESVKEYLKPFSNVTVHVGPIEEKSPELEAMQFHFVHVDVDIYNPTVHCLDFFWPRLCGLGVIVCDDYGFQSCKGTKKAVDDFVASHADCMTWYPHTGQYILQKKPAA